MRKVNAKRPPVLAMLFISFILVLLLSTVTIWFFVYREYSVWEKGFESDKFNDDYITLDNQSLKSSIDVKVDRFSKSSQKIDYIELTDREFAYIVSESINNSLPRGFKFVKGYVSSQKGSWDIYIKASIWNINAPWIRLNIVKENMESAQLYAKTMYMGNFDFKDYGFKGIVDRVNKGIADSLALVNESDFTGRIFKNIELDKGIITIKGEKF